MTKFEEGRRDQREGWVPAEYEADDIMAHLEMATEMNEDERREYVRGVIAERENNS